MITLYALSFGELYASLLSTMSLFLQQDSLMSLLRMSALIGIIMASVGYLKMRNPLVYAKWFVGYVLIMQLFIVPKTDVQIEDVTTQKHQVVEDVPVILAATASLFSSLGLELAEHYDALLSLPHSFKYTQSGVLVGSRLISALDSLAIEDPMLKQDVDDYVQHCVMEDVYFNQKYNLHTLYTSDAIFDLIHKHASRVRESAVEGAFMSCSDALDKLASKLEHDTEKSHVWQNLGLVGSGADVNISHLLETAGHYYHNVKVSAEDIRLQVVLIHAIRNHKRESHHSVWSIMGQKIAYFLPMLHTILLGLLLGLCPLYFVMATLPQGIKGLHYVLQWFVALQLWPVGFAVLNAAMMLYVHAQRLGALNVVSFDSIMGLHGDVLGITGYLMLLIVFLFKRFVSNVSRVLYP